MKHLYLLVLFLIICGNADAQLWRLVEVESQEMNLQTRQYYKIHSIRYQYDYNSSRGGLPDGNPILYAKMNYFKKVNGQFSNYEEHRQSFYPDDRRLVNEQYEPNTNGNFALTEADSFYYDNGRLSEMKTYTDLPAGQNTERWDWYEHELYFYDTVTGLLATKALWQQPVLYTQSVHFVSSQNYEYDSTGRLLSESIKALRTWVGGPNFPIITKRETYLYDTAGVLYKSFTDNQKWWNLSEYDTTHVTYYISDTNGNVIKDSMCVVDSMLNTLSSVVETFTYDTSGNLLTDSTWVEDTAANRYDLISVERFTYNQHGLLTSLTIDQPPSPGAFEYNTKVIYKYEHYWPAGIEQKVDENLQVRLYPNPVSSGVLTIRAQLKVEDAVAFTITDMQGRQIMHWQDDATQTYTKQIPVSHLSAGMYILMLEAGDSKTVRQFIVK